jgi:hypothetical protein
MWDLRLGMIMSRLVLYCDMRSQPDDASEKYDDEKQSENGVQFQNHAS